MEGYMICKVTEYQTKYRKYLSNPMELLNWQNELSKVSQPNINFNPVSLPQLAEGKVE